MPTTRRRPTAEFEATQPGVQTQTVTLSSLTGGYNNYTNPELLSPQMWASPTANVYSGLHAAVRRARWAPIANATSLGSWADATRILDLYGYLPALSTYAFIIADNSNTSSGTGYPPLPITVFTHGNSSITGFTNGWITLAPSKFVGPWMRFAASNMIFQTNGQVRSKISFQPTQYFYLDFWGLDAPDASPSISLASGTTATISTTSRTSNIVTITATTSLPANFVVGAWVKISGVTDTSYNSPTGTAFQILSVNSGADQFTYFQVGPNDTSSGGTATLGITKTVGRSYQFAWENLNNGQVSAPSPASQYVAYSDQTGTINCVQPGTIAWSNPSTTVTGTNTNFTSAWVGRYLWAVGAGILGGTALGWIVSVQSATQLTLNTAPLASGSGAQFQVCDVANDAQDSAIRLYATGDGQSTFLRIQRNLLNFAATTLAASGLQFTDTDEGEPPNDSFSTEIAQMNNVPPPIGTFLQEYQGRILVYGVTAAPQSLFYSNIESTVIGQPMESFAPLNEITMPIGEAQINGMANLPTGLLMWSSKQDMFKLTGQLTDNTVASSQSLGASIQRLPYRIGCASPYATCVTSLGAFWLSSDREIWLFTDHYAPKNVGKPIQNLLSQATRIEFARMKNYKAGDRNWLALALTIGSGSFNNTLCLLDLDLLASNGQPSFFTFDMATNQPSWYVYNRNCESLDAAYGNDGFEHLLVGDIDLVTDLDWQSGYYTVSSELSVPSSQLTLHAVGNQDPEVIKTGRWMRCTTNQLPKLLSSQGWNWSILCYDDDKYVLGINPKTVTLVPGVDSPNAVFGLEYSPSVFRFGGLKPVKGRRFQVQCTFPSGPGFYELRGYQISYDQVVER